MRAFQSLPEGEDGGTVPTISTSLSPALREADCRGCALRPHHGGGEGALQRHAALPLGAEGDKGLN